MRKQFLCLACKGTYFDTCSDGSSYAHVCGPLPATKDLPERERPDKRDENPLVSHGDRVEGIRSEGGGVECITDARLQEPSWVSVLKQRVADREEKENA